MNTITTTDEKNLTSKKENPGAQLGQVREKKGLTKEHVASKLHLRVKIIELLEKDDYEQMPEPVFIMGYIRAYAKLLAVSPEPYIEAFNNQYTTDNKPEKALWQSKRESNKSELVVRLITSLVVISALFALTFWWQKNKSEQRPSFVTKNKEEKTGPDKAEAGGLPSLNEGKAKLSQLSKMQSMFASNGQDSSEKPGD